MTRSDTIASQYHCRRTQGKIENDGVGGEELLVAGDDEGGGKVCGRMRPVSKTQELSRGSSGQTHAQLHTRETVEAH